MRRASADLTDPSRNLEESIGTPSPVAIDPEMDLSLPIDEEEEEEAAEEHESQYTPPSRIAARFYRPTQTRRKDSAASSRRNSISSVHSRSSHGFGRGEDTQSKYIAQQLRRASILEDRKARLADRAAHAEKVRLRAAMAKAAQQKNSNSEERALAAAQARETKLAEIVAACAEEVKRAKAVAESMKEKREQNLRKLKEQMEERLAEADRRREELRSRHASKRSRGQSMTSKKPEDETSPESRELKDPMSHDVAVSKLQWWWRGALRRKAVREFSELGLTIDTVRDTSFEKVVELLSRDKVLTTTARVLRISGLEEGEASSVNEMAAVRTFLSAFLILGHPTQVLSNKDNNGEQEEVGPAQGQPMPRGDLANPQLQDLVGKARDLLISFETILSRLTIMNNYTPPPSLRDTLPEAYATFHNAFIAWKARDSNALIEVMILQFVELDAILETVKEGTEEHVTDAYRQSIKDNQLMLMVRIKRLAGPQRGKKLIFDAVREARKARVAKKPAGDTRPRVAEHSPDNGNPSNDESSAENVVAAHLRTLTPPPTPTTSGKTTKRSPLQLAYPPILPDNRVIVHELAINREYRIEYQHFQEQHKMRMDPLFQDLKSGDRNEEKEFHYLIVMSNYIKDRLQHLVKPGSSMYIFIGEILDTEVAQQQFMTGSFSYEKFFSAMGSLLPKLCAPVRDAEVKELAETKLTEGHVVERLEALLSFIDTMLYDYANYMMQVAAPNLIEHASLYEAKRFTEELESGSLTLTRAEVSWRSARAKVHAEAARRDPEGINHPKLRPTPDKIYWQMLLDEFTQPSPSADSVPEPLALDTKRRARLGSQTLRIVTAGAILLQCKNILKRDVRAPWRTEAGRIFTVLEATEDQNKPLPQAAAIDGIMAALEAGRSMPQATKGHLRALVTKVLTANCEAKRDNAEPREPVLRLLLSRVRGHILGRLQAGSASEKVKATSVAGERLAGLGLPEFVEKVREMVDELAKVGAVDREAHGIWWEKVAQQVGQEAATE